MAAKEVWHLDLSADAETQVVAAAPQSLDHVNSRPDTLNAGKEMESLRSAMRSGVIDAVSVEGGGRSAGHLKDEGSACVSR